MQNQHRHIHYELDWPTVWKKVCQTLERKNAPKEVIAASTDDAIRCEVKNNVMYLSVPCSLRDYIEQNMDCFKPILWPFIKFNKCRKLIYKPIKHSNNHGTNQ